MNRILEFSRTAVRFQVAILLMTGISIHSVNALADDSQNNPSSPGTPPNQLQKTLTTPSGVPFTPSGLSPAGSPHSGATSLDPSNQSQAGVGIQFHFGAIKKEPVPTNDAGEEEDGD